MAKPKYQIMTAAEIAEDNAHINESVRQQCYENYLRNQVRAGVKDGRLNRLSVQSLERLVDLLAEFNDEVS